MALNDMSMRAQGTDVYPGVSNPTQSSAIADPLATNFVDDPTKDEAGAGAGPDFAGHKDAKKAMRGAAGVVESHPGIIEDTNIDPLNENSNKDDGWANVTGTKERMSETVSSSQKGTSSAWNNASSTATSTLNSAMDVATGAAKMAYGTVTGNQEHVEQGKQSVFGERR